MNRILSLLVLLGVLLVVSPLFGAFNTMATATLWTTSGLLLIGAAVWIIITFWHDAHFLLSSPGYQP